MHKKLSILFKLRGIRKGLSPYLNIFKSLLSRGIVSSCHTQSNIYSFPILSVYSIDINCFNSHRCCLGPLFILLHQSCWLFILQLLFKLISNSYTLVLHLMKLRASWSSLRRLLLSIFIPPLLSYFVNTLLSVVYFIVHINETLTCHYSFEMDWH